MNPQEVDSASFSQGGDFDIQVLPWGLEFDIATTCFGQKAVPWDGNLTLALVKMSNSPGSACHPLPWGLTLIGVSFVTNDAKVSFSFSLVDICSTGLHNGRDFS